MTQDVLELIPDSMLFEEVPCYITVHDLEGKILKSNRRFREIFGNRLGDYCYEVYRNRNSTCPVCPIDSIRKHHQPVHHEEVFFTPEGDPVNVLVNTAPLFDKSGNLVALIEIATDITEEKMLQHKLEDSRERYKTIYNEVPCFISVQDRQFRLLDYNNRFQAWFHGAKGEYCYEVYKKRKERCEVCPVAEAFEDGQIHSSEEIVSSFRGDIMHTLVLAAPIKDRDGNVSSVMEMSTDITQLKQMQTQMESLGRMMSSLAHTIKGIITGLEGGMYVVESGLKKKNDELVNKGWGMVQRNVDRISHLVLDMLSFAKPRDPEITEFDLAKLCRDIRELFDKKFRDEGINTELILPETILVKGDSKAYFTLILTLLENAIDACKWDDSKDMHNIGIEVSQDVNDVTLTISDNGMGMTDEVKNKVFTTQYSTKGNSGSGFGLMLVKKIILEHRGEIKVSSELGIGTRFIATIPKG
jgi:PAS domain S-box-containing protein